MRLSVLEPRKEVVWPVLIERGLAECCGEDAKSRLRRGLEVGLVVVSYSGMDVLVLGLLVGKGRRDAFVCETGRDVTCGA